MFPSREEPFGNVVVEAWAYGVPWLPRPAGPGLARANGEDAILVPVDDPDALAYGIREVLGSKELASIAWLRMVASGSNSEFSEQEVIGKYLDMFERVRPKGQT